MAAVGAQIARKRIGIARQVRRSAVGDGKGVRGCGKVRRIGVKQSIAACGEARAGAAVSAGVAVEVAADIAQRIVRRAGRIDEPAAARCRKRAGAAVAVGEVAIACRQRNGVARSAAADAAAAAKRNIAPRGIGEEGVAAHRLRAVDSDAASAAEQGKGSVPGIGVEAHQVGVGCAADSDAGPAALDIVQLRGADGKRTGAAGDAYRIAYAGGQYRERARAAEVAADGEIIRLQREVMAAHRLRAGDGEQPAARDQGRRRAPAIGGHRQRVRIPSCSHRDVAGGNVAQDRAGDLQCARRAIDAHRRVCRIGLERYRTTVSLDRRAGEAKRIGVKHGIEGIPGGIGDTGVA